MTAENWFNALLPDPDERPELCLIEGGADTNDGQVDEWTLPDDPMGEDNAFEWEPNEPEDETQQGAVEQAPVSGATSPKWEEGDYVPGGNDGSGSWKLGDSAVAPLVAAARGYETIQEEGLPEATKSYNLPRKTSAQGKRIAEAVTHGDLLIMPWFTAQVLAVAARVGRTALPSTTQYRPSRPALNAQGKEMKYEFVGGQKTPVGVHPSFPREWIDAAPRVLIAEGLLKGDSALTGYLLDAGVSRESLAFDGVGGTAAARARLADILDSIPLERRVLILTVGGVWNWRNNSEWVDLDLRNRETWVGVDGDVASNPQVHKACVELWEFLSKKKKTTPRLIAPTVQAADGEKKVGIDDYLAKYGDWRGLVAMLADRLPKAPPERETPADEARASSKRGGTSAGVFGEVSDPEIARAIVEQGIAHTHMGLAERVIMYYGEELAYRPTMDLFMVYTGGVWVPDRGSTMVKARIRRTIRAITAHEARFAEELSPAVRKAAEMAASNPTSQTLVDLEQAKKAARDAVERFGVKCENGQEATNAALAALKEPLVVEERHWNAHPFLVNFPNGTVNVKHCDEDGWPILREHDPLDRITCTTAVDYMPRALSDDLESVRAHLDQSGPGTYECVTRFLGYGITGAMDAKRFMNFFGAANAAKSTLTNAGVITLGGDSDTSYVAVLSPGDLGVKSDGHAGPMPAIDAARGKRWWIVAEAERMYMSGDLVKKITGGDTIRTRGLYESGGPWTPSGKIVAIGNGPSKFAAHDEGMVNRAIFVKVEALDPSKIREGVKYRLEQTQEGQVAVLAMLVKAAADWYRDYKVVGMSAAEALRVPEHCKQVKDETLVEINPLSQWIEERCTRVIEGDPATTFEGAAPVGVLRNLYNDDAVHLRLKPMGPREFSKALGALPGVGEKQTEFRVANVDYKGRIKTGIRYADGDRWAQEMVSGRR